MEKENTIVYAAFNTEKYRRCTQGCEEMKPFQKCAPTQRYIIETLRKSPMPWTTGMIMAISGHNYPGGNLVYLMKCCGRLIELQRGVYQAGRE